ncbi:alpha/beta hydrolase, partial [Pseudomonas sp.]|uniref:alpha/beta hydrolase n=1 Tax=Pseudomonas sp. TaxID=306 RepID=UPI003CC69955
MSLLPFSLSRLVRPLALGVALASLASLAACAGAPPADDDGMVSLQEYLKTAYNPGQSNKLDGWATRWAWGTHQVNLSLLVPAGHKNVPLVVYLPGLGEDDSAGQLWRQSWANAGYAVLTVQPTRYDSSVYKSADAQAGAFRGIAANSYANAALQDRAAEVVTVLAEVRRRGLAGEAGFSAVDVQHTVVAGYDLGAQTAAALAGERDPGQVRLTEWRPMGVIVLSPYVAAGADPARFAQVDTPVLSVTGPLDEDPFSWVASAQQRFAFFDGLGGHGAYQLRLQDASHKDLSGTVAHAEGGKPGQAKGERHHGGGPEGGGPGGGGPGGEGRSAGKPMDLGVDRRQAASVAAVSTAWL